MLSSNPWIIDTFAAGDFTTVCIHTYCNFDMHYLSCFCTVYRIPYFYATLGSFGRPYCTAYCLACMPLTVRSAEYYSTCQVNTVPVHVVVSPAHVLVEIDRSISSLLRVAAVRTPHVPPQLWTCTISTHVKQLGLHEPSRNLPSTKKLVSC